jgi:5'-3' exonuclease
MGIPSYFRGILQKYPSCLINSVKSGTLCFDFNCLIYRCIRAASMPKYPEGAYTDSEENEYWERALLVEIEKTVLEVWSIAGKPHTVYIAVDGVVPMAKIRQQRVRRFKSSWLRKTVGASRCEWDTNSITPGTKFMEKLGMMLKALALRSGKWIVSGVDEEGEGEHKIMNWLRKEKVNGPVVVYGLDADLILLTMLVSEQKGLDMFLLREKQEFSKEVSSTQLYQFLTISEFKMRLGLSGEEEVLNYIGLMSLMGNDFLPHSLTHKLSDGGHDCVIGELYRLRKTGWLVGLNGKFKHDVLIQIFKKWSIDEEGRMLQMIHKKREQASRGIGKGMDVSEGLPLEWAVEKELITGGPKGGLSEGWRDIYWTWIHPYWTEEHKDYICAEYLKGFQWILDYYQGIPVNKSWMFPAWIPPLWSDLSSYVKEVGHIELEDVSPEPQEQLAMVLPLESWGLIRSHALRRLPTLSPQMWPLNFGFFSLGRKWLWECEARIPVLTAGRLREILRTGV